MAEFSNPNQQGGQDNRSLVSMMVVLVAVFFGFQYYRSKTNPPASPPPPTVATQSAPASAQSPPVPQPVVPGFPATPSRGLHGTADQAPVPAVPVVQASAESETVVENELYRIRFSNRGASVASWVLKQHKDSDGKPLDLVNLQAAKLFGFPLSLYTYDGANASIATVSRSGNLVTIATSGNLPADWNGRAIAVAGVAESTYNGTFFVTQTGPNTLTYPQAGENNISKGGTLSTVNGLTGEQLGQALFVPSATGQVAAPTSLTFRYSNGDVQATKTFSFDETYVLHADILVTRAGQPIRALLSWPGGFGDQDEVPNGGAYSGSKFDAYRNATDQHLEPKKVSGGETLNGPFDWAGISDPFFGAVFLPDSPTMATVVTLHGEMDVARTLKRVGFGSGSPPTKPVEMPILGAALGDTSGHTQTRIFAGPKEINVLKGVRATNANVTLEPMLEFGFWGLIGKYLFLSLYFIHSHIASNWGWSIIILTVLINILTLPFKVKTMQSALKMQRIQPQMDAIKEKYKKFKVTDPKRNEMNAEIMQLQKDNGVNMFGGCIPTLITLPMLWAFFTMLPRVVELRQAHWLWLPDLQAPDPWRILPVLMGVSMFVVQYYTPSPGVDPQQQKMMAFMMPAVSVYFTWNYGSGLALYWATGNLISIAQQAVMNRTSLGREMREIAAKRARRKATTIQGRK